MGFVLKEDILTTPDGTRVIRCRDGDALDFFTIFNPFGRCVTVTAEEMVDICAKMGNYFGLTKMEIPPSKASIQKALQKTCFFTEPPGESGDGSVNGVEIRGGEDAVE